MLRESQGSKGRVYEAYQVVFSHCFNWEEDSRENLSLFVHIYIKRFYHKVCWLDFNLKIDDEAH